MSVFYNRIIMFSFVAFSIACFPSALNASERKSAFNNYKNTNPQHSRKYRHSTWDHNISPKKMTQKGTNNHLKCSKAIARLKIQNPSSGKLSTRSSLLEAARVIKNIKKKKTKSTSKPLPKQILNDYELETPQNDLHETQNTGANNCNQFCLSPNDETLIAQDPYAGIKQLIQAKKQSPRTSQEDSQSVPSNQTDDNSDILSLSTVDDALISPPSQDNLSDTEHNDPEMDLEFYESEKEEEECDDEFDEFSFSQKAHNQLDNIIQEQKK